ncbi:hypothetical protein EXE42_11695 [Halorubrum sp. SP3]|nr:hypothetical protein EXE42_11695 [Halorubrum sp. SP3]
MPASGRSEAEAARSTREGVGRRAKRGRPTRLGRCEVRSLCGAGWDSKGQSRGRSRRSRELRSREPIRTLRVLMTT